MTLFEALTGGAFDRLNCQHSGEFDQNFSKKSNAPGFARGGMGGFGIDRYISEQGIAVLLTEKDSKNTHTVLKKFYSEVRKSDFDNSFMLN